MARDHNMISCLCIQSIYLRLFWSRVDYTVGMIQLLFPYLWPQMSSNLTGGKDGRLLVIFGTPITRSLLLSGLMTREFVQHNLAIDKGSLFNTITRKILLYNPNKLLHGTDRRSFTYSLNRKGSRIEPGGTQTGTEEGWSF